MKRQLGHLLGEHIHQPVKVVKTNREISFQSLTQGPSCNCWWCFLLWFFLLVLVGKLFSQKQRRKSCEGFILVRNVGDICFPHSPPHCQYQPPHCQYQPAPHFKSSPSFWPFPNLPLPRPWSQYSAPYSLLSLALLRWGFYSYSFLGSFNLGHYPPFLLVLGSSQGLSLKASLFHCAADSETLNIFWAVLELLQRLWVGSSLTVFTLEHRKHGWCQ